jgi:hypothetical protein
MNRCPRAGARSNLVRRPRVVSIGDKNPREALPRHIRQIFVTRLNRIDTEIATSVPNEVPVEIVAMRLGKPRPGENIFQDFSHFISFKSVEAACPILFGW